MLFQIETVLFTLIMISLVNAHSNGAPEGVCGHLIPQHKVRPQTGQSPYQVLANTETSISGENGIHIIINSIKGTPFRGFIIQARMATDLNTTVDGKFKVIDEVNSHTVSCNGGVNNTLTHSNPKDKQEITAKWFAPENFNKEVIFLVSIVKDVKTFWINQSSQSISLNDRSVSSDTTLHEHSHQHEDILTSTTEGHPFEASGDNLSGSSSTIYLNFLAFISVFSILFI